MLNVVSQNIPLIDHLMFEQVEDRINTKTPNPYRKKYDSGEQKKTSLDDWLSGFGSNDRKHNSGAGVGIGREENKDSQTSLSSGYNDGGQADDEIGEGNKSVVPDPYYAVRTNELFIDLELKAGDRDRMNKGKSFLDRLNPIEYRRNYHVQPVN